MAYPFSEIELKWQEYWRSHATFHAERDPSKAKYFVLDMFAYPSGEGLHIGHPTKHHWPTLDLEASPDVWFEMLHEPRVLRLFREGYRKTTTETSEEIEPLPFTLVPSLMQRLFRIACHERPPDTSRQIIDRYFTAFFNAWLDCQGLREAGTTN